MYVVVRFYPCFKFYFPLFWGHSSLKQRKIEFKPQIKLNRNIYVLREVTQQPGQTYILNNYSSRPHGL